MVDYSERKGMYKSADGSREIDQVFADIAAYLQNKEDEI